MLKKLHKFSKSNIGKGLSSGTTVFLVTNLTAILLTPFILGNVSKTEYGLYVLCLDFFVWAGFLQFGTAKVLGPVVARELGKKDESEIVFFFNSAFWFQLVVSILLVPLFYGAVNYSLDNSISAQNFGPLIMLFSIAAFFQSMTSQLSEMIRATRKIHLDNYIKIGVLIIRTLLIIALTPHFGIVSVFGIYLALTVIEFIKSLLRVRHLYPDLEIKFKLFSKSHLKILFSDGIYFSLSSLATIFILKFDNFFLGRHIGLDFITELIISIKLAQLCEKFLANTFNTIRPYISNLRGGENLKAISTLYNALNISIIGVASAMFGAVLIFNKWFVTWWVGDEYYIGSNLVPLYILFSYLNSLTLPTRTLLVSTLSFVKNLTMSVFLHGFLRFGVILLLFGKLGLELLPMSNIVSLWIFGLAYPIYLVTKTNFGGNKLTQLMFILGAPVIAFIVLLEFGPEYLVYFLFMVSVVSIAIFFNRGYHHELSVIKL